MSGTRAAKSIAFVALTAAALSGCVGAAPVDGESTDELSTATAFANDKAGVRLLRRQGAHQLSGGGHRRQPRPGVGRQSRRRCSTAADPGAASRSGRSAGAGTPRRTTTCWRTRRPRASRGLAQPPARVHLVRAHHLRLRLLAAQGDDERHRRDRRVPGQVRDLRHLRLRRSASPTRKSVLARVRRGAAYWRRRSSASRGRSRRRRRCTVKCGESVAANIVLKNTGTKTWNASTEARHDDAARSHQHLRRHATGCRRTARRRSRAPSRRAPTAPSRSRSTARPAPPASRARITSTSASCRRASPGSATTGRAGRPTIRSKR